jgi:hexokinase
LSEATLLPMGKGFAITTDLNLGEMLLAGYSSHCVSSMKGSPVSDQLSATNGRPLPIIRVAAITNDTVATFVSLAYAVKATPNSRVVMGLIVGTGTNATVPIRPDNLHPEKRSQLQNLKAAEAVVINTEWTIRGTDEPLEALGIKTQWDRTLDANSEVPGFQPFEYMTSGRYLGEIVRLIFIDVVCAEDMDEGCMLPSPLRHKNAIPTRLLSEVVARVDEDSLRDRLEKIYPSIEPNIINFWTLARVRLLRQIAQAVQQRSSALIAAACIGLLGCSGDINLYETAPLEPDLNCNASDATSNVEELVIAYTGSTISQYPHWLEDCQKWIDTLVTASKVNSGRKIVMKEAIDGGIIGAGVLAGMGDTITS